MSAKGRKNGSFGKILALCGNPQVNLLPVAVTCLPAADSGMIELFNSLASEAALFKAQADQRIRSAMTLGKKDELALVEAWNHQQTVIEKGSRYIALHTQLSQTLDRFALHCDDRVISSIIQLRRATVMYDHCITQTSSLKRANADDKQDDPDLNELILANDKAGRFRKHLGETYVTLWVDRVKSEIKTADESIAGLGVSPEKGLVDVDYKSIGALVAESAKVEFVHSKFATSCTSMKTMISKIGDYTDCYTSLTYTVSLPGAEQVGITSFCNTAKVVCARGKLALCCLSLWGLVFDGVPSASVRQTEMDSLKRDINVSIDHARSPFPSKLLLLSYHVFARGSC